MARESRCAPIYFKRCLWSSGYFSTIIGFMQRSCRCTLCTLFAVTGGSVIILVFELYWHHGGDADSLSAAIEARF